ncbi:MULTISPECIES: sensor histidine kinase [unclassified Paenibacillus]|uniref:sensor histidine kinase n=1 Tax=unclassified Paenibacillus TaxID=185978 RepID=UPI001AE83C8A|nr:MULTISPECIES: sensor histidine kinase [unclassified Paenibacillus]MBP1155506.1 signal transduction histidine kinase [Paenibacillus sp. PvP091]MBP1169108.1 signal transduction histidine kinase [Paenibacillus sp. PvR098]MBP2440136.1 signal transduction histidine kinase [Paenibacillus sp. PvP052]
MLFVLIGLWSIGLLLIVTDPKRQTTRWISSIAFIGGSGGMAAVIGDQLTPYLYARGWLTEPLTGLLPLVETICSHICYYGLPYTFLMFAVVYYPEYALWSRRRYIPWVLLVPVLFSFAFEPKLNEPIPYSYVTLWAMPYILTGIGLLMAATLKERNSFLRRSRLLTTAAAAPTLFFALFTLYLLPHYFETYEWWRYNAWVIAFTLAVIIGSSFRYGFMGLQISIQNQKLDYTLRAITSGTSILNHAIKNDVGKIRLFGDKIKLEIASGKADSSQVIQDVEVILQASQHIYDMIYRIQGQTQEAELAFEEVRPAELMRQCLHMLSPELARIEVSEEYSYGGTMSGDRALLTEVWTNVLTNAIEAMPGGGRLTVRLTETKRKIVVEIKDSGPGMEKHQLKRVFDPFYSTKSGKNMNFGLGLSYCYNIVQKHKGTMSIHSKPGQGTSVFMQFPKRKTHAAERELV